MREKIIYSILLVLLGIGFWCFSTKDKYSDSIIIETYSGKELGREIENGNLAKKITDVILAITPDLNNCELKTSGGELTRTNYTRNGLKQEVYYKNGNSTTTLEGVSCATLINRNH